MRNGSNSASNAQSAEHVQHQSQESLARANEGSSNLKTLLGEMNIVESAVRNMATSVNDFVRTLRTVPEIARIVVLAQDVERMRGAVDADAAKKVLEYSAMVEKAAAPASSRVVKNLRRYRPRKKWKMLAPCMIVLDRKSVV